MTAENFSRGGPETTANVATRNFILGLPRDGPAPGSGEAASFQAAEAFIGEIRQEIIAYDVANARAMEAYVQKCWGRVPFFGKLWGNCKSNNYSNNDDDSNKKTNNFTTVNDNNNNNTNNSDGVERGVSVHASMSAGQLGGASPAVCGGGGQQGVIAAAVTGNTIREGCCVERTSASLSDSTKHMPQRRMNSWLFKKCHPGWVPLIQRWWVPFVCMGGILLIWTPDVWKLRTLYWCDYKYALFRQAIHKAYWRASMSPEDYGKLMLDLEMERPISVNATKCPL